MEWMHFKSKEQSLTIMILVLIMRIYPQILVLGLTSDRLCKKSGPYGPYHIILKVPLKVDRPSQVKAAADPASKLRSRNKESLAEVPTISRFYPGSARFLFCFFLGRGN